MIFTSWTLGGASGCSSWPMILEIRPFLLILITFSCKTSRLLALTQARLYIILWYLLIRVIIGSLRHSSVSIRIMKFLLSIVRPVAVESLTVLLLVLIIPRSDWAGSARAVRITTGSIGLHVWLLVVHLVILAGIWLLQPILLLLRVYSAVVVAISVAFVHVLLRATVLKIVVFDHVHVSVTWPHHLIWIIVCIFLRLSAVVIIRVRLPILSTFFVEVTTSLWCTWFLDLLVTVIRLLDTLIHFRTIIELHWTARVATFMIGRRTITYEIILWNWHHAIVICILRVSHIPRMIHHHRTTLVLMIVTVRAKVTIIGALTLRVSGGDVRR